MQHIKYLYVYHQRSSEVRANRPDFGGLEIPPVNKILRLIDVLVIQSMIVKQ